MFDLYTMPNNQTVFSFTEKSVNPREILVGRWLDLARNTLPAMATQNRWPISADHCFMRVCLDTAIGQPWHLMVKRPAIRHLTDQQLLAAIRVAEGVVLAPQTLDALNRQSVAWREKTRRPQI